MNEGRGEGRSRRRSECGGLRREWGRREGGGGVKAGRGEEGRGGADEGGVEGYVESRGGGGRGLSQVKKMPSNVMLRDTRQKRT